MTRRWQGFAGGAQRHRHSTRGPGGRCPTVRGVRLRGRQRGGFHGWGRRHFIQIQAVSQHPARREDVRVLRAPAGCQIPHPGPQPSRLPAPIQLGARVSPTTRPCPDTYARLSPPRLSAPSHATRKQDFCLGKPRSSSRSEMRSRT